MITRYFKLSAGLVLTATLLLTGIAGLARQAKQGRKSAARKSGGTTAAPKSKVAKIQTRSGRQPSLDVVERVREELDEAQKRFEGYDQPDQAAEYYLRKRLPEGESQLPVERYFVAREQMRRMPQYSTRQDQLLPSRAETGAESAAGEWTSLGPGNIGGRTRALLINPINPNVLYAAGVAGGVWKTVDGGAKWNPSGDLLPNLAVSSLAMDPKNPEVIYAGTGEGFFNSDAARGAGIFRTVDGGATWARVAGTNTPDFYYVNDIVVSPNNSSRIYAATRSGVMRSLDGGATWARILDPQLNAGCLDLAVRTDRPTDVLFAACGSFQQAVVYRNADAGGTGAWAEVLKDPGMGRTSIGIAPSNQNIVYVASASIVSGPFLNGLHAVFRSTSGGDAGSWTAQVRNTSARKLNTVLFSNPLAAHLGECGLAPSVFNNQGWYDNIIAVDPADPGRVWVGGVDLFRSDDGGANWGLASYWWADKDDPHYAHADHHVLAFPPQYNGTTNRQMFVGTDGGIFRTENARAPVATEPGAACNPASTGVAWISLNNNYGVTQFYHGAVFPDGKTYFGGTQDNGTLLGTDDSGAGGWREIFGGDGGYVAVNPDNPNQIFVETTRLSLRKSTDGGKTFGSAILGVEEPSSSFGFIAPFVMDPSDPQRLWLGGGTIWQTTNGGANWRTGRSAGSSLPAGGNVTALAVSPTNADYAIAGASTGYILQTSRALSADGNTNWDYIQPRSGFVSGLAFDPANHNIAYATYATFGGAHVWRSDNGGIDWKSIDGVGPNSLPDIPAHCIVVDPSNTSRLYVGTDLGVFVSPDGGATWAVENTGFANVVVEALSLNVVGGTTTLYAFTHGRGVWRVTINNSGCSFALSPPSQFVGASAGSGVVTVKASPGNCGWRAESNANWIQVNGNSGGSGDGTVQYQVLANTSFAPRAGTITLAGRSFAVFQSGARNDGPVITINSPANTGVINVDNGTIEIKGIATSIAGIERIGWESDRVDGFPSIGSFPIDTTREWQILAGLRPGRNNIRITAQDTTGKTAVASLAINLNSAFQTQNVAGTGAPGFSGDGGPATAAQLGSPLRLAIDARGNLFFSDTINHRIRKVSADGTISTVAGSGPVGQSGGGFGGDGGPATEAQLNFPTGVAVDGAGNLYISDSANHRIRKVTPDGKINTVAGSGTRGFAGDGGPATAAQFDGPDDIVIDRVGNLLVADTYNNRIRKITPAGTISTFAGGGFASDGSPAQQAYLQYPRGLGIDGAGNVYTTTDDGSRIRKIDAVTGIITNFAGGNNNGDIGDGGPATQARLLGPKDIAADVAGNIYIADGNRIRKVTPAGIINTVAGNGNQGPGQDGLPATATEVSPLGLAFGSEGILHFADLEHYRIRWLVPFTAEATAPTISISTPTSAASYVSNLPQITLAGTATDNTRVAQVRWRNARGGSGAAEGTAGWRVGVIALQTGLNYLTVTAWDESGNAASASLAIIYDPAKFVKVVAGTGAAGDSLQTNSAACTQLSRPETVAFDAAGNLYIADRGNHRILKVGRDGKVTTFAGNGQLGSRGDGGPAINAEFNSPSGLAVDASGAVYVSDTNNHRVRRIAPDGVITTVAGNGLDGFSSDGGPATGAKLDAPVGLAFDGTGNLYIADAGNNRVRKLNLQSGTLTTAAGKGYGSGGDGGPALDALFYYPTAVAFDRAGNMFVSDTGNHRIRKVSPSGTISAFAGTGVRGFDGDGGLAKEAQLDSPGGLTVDGGGSVYFTDQLNDRIRIVKSDGTISTFAGGGQPGAEVEGNLPTAVRLFAPAGVAFDAAGNLFIADTNNHRIVAVIAFRNATSVSAASFTGPVAASEQIIAAFGSNLATRTEIATVVPLPTSLAGTVVKVKDSAGVERPAPQFFVSPGQINYQIPPGTGLGPATISITNAEGVVSTGGVVVAPVAPGLFTANASGQGVAAAVILRVKADGAQSYEPVAVFDPAQNRFVARPIDLGPPGDQVFLLLFGTGVRGHSSLAAVNAVIGGVNAEVLFVGAQGGFVGLDQINVRLPRALAGRGEIDVVLVADGKMANVVRVNTK